MARHLRYVTITALACLLLGLVGVAGGELKSSASADGTPAHPRSSSFSTESSAYRTVEAARAVLTVPITRETPSALSLPVDRIDGCVPSRVDPDRPLSGGPCHDGPRPEVASMMLAR